MAQDNEVDVEKEQRPVPNAAISSSAVDGKARAEELGLTRRPLLTQADVGLLAQAIKEGNIPDPPSRRESVRSGIVVAVVALLVSGLLYGAWELLHWWRPATVASLNAIIEPTQVHVGPGAAGVSWSTAAYVDEIQFYPGDQPQSIALPLSPSKWCPVMKEALQLPCTKSNSLVSRGIISIHWNRDQGIFLGGIGQPVTPVRAATSSSVQMNPEDFPLLHQDAFDLNFNGTEQVTWCAIGTPLITAGETITVATLKRSVTISVPHLPSPAPNCKTGLHIRERHLGRLTSQVNFDGVSSLSVATRAASFQASGITGTLDLDNDIGPWTVDPAARTILKAGPRQIAVSVDDSPGHTNLRIFSANIASASNNSPDLVTSYWDRETSTAVTDFLSVLTAALAIAFSAHLVVRRHAKKTRPSKG
jgi:hypothetical protein